MGRIDEDVITFTSELQPITGREDPTAPQLESTTAVRVSDWSQSGPSPMAIDKDKSSVVVDLVAGTVGGIGGVVVGQPFDTVRRVSVHDIGRRWAMVSGTPDALFCALVVVACVCVWCVCVLCVAFRSMNAQVKVRLQTHSSYYNGALDCARQTVCVQFGWLLLYLCVVVVAVQKACEKAWQRPDTVHTVSSSNMKGRSASSRA